MKLQTKLLLHSFISIVIALFILSFVIQRMLGMQSTANTFSDTLIKVEQLNSSMVSYQQALDNFGKNQTEGNRVNANNKYKDFLQKALILESVTFSTENEKRRIDMIRNKIDHIRADMKLVAASDEKNRIEAMKLSSKMFGIMNDIYILSLSLHEQHDSLSKQNNSSTVTISVASGLILLLVSSVISLYITRTIVRPIKALSDYSQRIASGDLSIKAINYDHNDEVGQLTRSFHTMKLNLSELIDTIKSNADELKRRNERIQDSISYAKRIQESIIPHERKLAELFRDHFLIWSPKDMVGGDFYWTHRTKSGYYVAVGDCTGHGVPGALMSILSISSLKHVVDQEKRQDLSPADILRALNRMIKKDLNQQIKGGLTDDGLDIGLCYIEDDKVTFAGSKLSLYIQSARGLTEIKGDKKSIGYHRTPDEYEFTNHTTEADANTTFFITTDGLVHQNGGETDYSLGKKRLMRMITDYSALPLDRQKDGLLSELKKYMGEQPQRDDITLIAFIV